MLTPELEQVLEKYNEGLALYKLRKWTEARVHFQAALDAKPDDGPSKLYVERCDHFLENPPPEDWDGVFTMTTK
ncbi:MAG: tetratricopeptide repeat protein [Leptospirales bacterium]